MTTVRLLQILLIMISDAHIAQAIPDTILNLKQNAIVQSISFARVSDSKVLFSKNANSLLSPASVSKIVTSMALLKRFGPNHTFKTKVYYQGQIKNDTLMGDLIIVGGGDPSFVSENLWQIATDLRHYGITKVTGHLIIDHSIFDRHYRDASRKNNIHSSNHAYDAPISGFGLNFNTVALTIAPGSKVGSFANVEVDPYPSSNIIVKNNIKTVAPSYREKIRVTRFKQNNNQSTLKLSGSIKLDSKLKKVYRSIINPELHTALLVKSFLKSQGVLIKGSIQSKKSPKNKTFLTEHSSKPLSLIIRDLNIYSNNYIADVLTKQLAIDTPQAIGSFTGGAKKLVHFLRKHVGIKEGFTLKNGSGLSTHNRLSANNITQTLIYASKQSDLFPEFLASLPISGTSGTLKKRFLSRETKHLKGKIRAKTGTLTQPITVSSLGGYLYHKKHGMLAFSMIQNGLPNRRQPSLKDLHDHQERLLNYISNKL